MQIIIQELRELVQNFSPKINDISDHDFAAKPNPEKWSKIEVLGHLIDSGQNNLRRFICGQYESSPPLIVYNQDFWVASNNYRSANKQDIIQLWRLVNDQICQVLNTMPRANYSKKCNTGTENPKFLSLEWLARDYVKHMKHHLNQIFPNSFDIVYP